MLNTLLCSFVNIDNKTIWNIWQLTDLLLTPVALCADTEFCWSFILASLYYK